MHVGRDALGVEHEPRETRPAQEIDGDLRLLVGDEHGGVGVAHEVFAHVPLGLRRLVALVRVDDVLDDPVTHDVAAAELDEHEALDVFEHRPHGEEPRAAAAVGKVDLGDVAGDDGLRAEAEPGEEHLHLLGGRVLRLVEDDERVVERAAPHVGERRDLDRAPFHEPADRVGLDHVVERVVERAQVRVDLGEHVSGQEARAARRLRPRDG